MNYVLAADNREQYKAISKMQEKAIKNKIVTMVWTLVIMIFLLYLGMYLTGTIQTMTWVIITLCTLIDNINVRNTTAYRVRSTWLGFMIKMASVKLRIILMRKPYITEDDVHIAIEQDIQRRYNSYRHQWAKLDSKYLSKEDNKIDMYWQMLGLNDKEIKRRTKCIRITAEVPWNVKEVKQNYCYVAFKNLPPNHPFSYSYNTWKESDLSDDMHVKSLYKRCCGQKKTIDLKAVDNMEYANRNTNMKLPRIKITREQSVIKALGTSGSAGQFSKKSNYEEIWKNSTSQEAVTIWSQMIENALECVYMTNEFPQEIAGYMLYRKREAIGVADDGMKETRLMNAPNLMTRILDSATFSSYNEAMIEIREKDASSIGMNIFQELSMIMYHDPGKIMICTDYSDYDGSQHPTQSFHVARARVKYMKENNQPIIERAYIAPRYDAHMNRVVKSTFGIRYHVIGSQASGDITTSDDNTEKTKCGMVETTNGLVQEKLIKTSQKVHVIGTILDDPEINANANGDDTALIVTPTDLWSDEKANQIMTSKTANLGWTIKEGSFQAHNMVQDGRNEYLSHSVTRRRFMTQHRNKVIEFATLTRPRDRAYAKWGIAAEMSVIPSKTERGKLSSKYLSLTMACIGNPEIMAASLHMLNKLRTGLINTDTPWSWSGIKATTLADITLNKCLEMQLCCELDDRYDYIEVTNGEKMMINMIEEMLNIDIDNDNTNHNMKSMTSWKDSTVKDNWWNYRQYKYLVVNHLRELDRRSYTNTPIQSHKWWNERDNSEESNTFDKVTKNKGGVNRCKHIHMNIVGHPTTKYDINLKCKECYDTTIEKYYTGKYICITSLTSEDSDVKDNCILG
jgi:ribosomal protein L44E